MRTAVLGALAVVSLALPATASADTTGWFSSVTATRDGRVDVSAGATIWACEQERTGQQIAEGAAGTCGGRLTLVVTPPTVRRDSLGVLEPAGCRPHLFGSRSLWNDEGVREWVRTVSRWGARAANPPERIVWMGPILTSGGEQPPLALRFKTGFGLWPGGMVDTPCLYLAYFYRDSGTLPEAGCLEEFPHDIREYFCEEEYWSDVTFRTLAQTEVPTPFPRCEGAQRAYRKVKGRWLRLLRNTYGEAKAWRRTKQRRRALRGELKRAETRSIRSCPRLG